MSRWKITFALMFIGIILVSALVVWAAEANIDYGINTDYVYQKEDDQWVTLNWLNGTKINGTFIEIECLNRGGFAGSFSLSLTFTNASVVQATVEPYEVVGSNTARLSFQLDGHEAHSRAVYFTLDGDVRGFSVSFSLESNQLLLRSDATILRMQTTNDTLYYDYFDNRLEPRLLA